MCVCELDFIDICTLWDIYTYIYIYIYIHIVCIRCCWQQSDVRRVWKTDPLLLSDKIAKSVQLILDSFNALYCIVGDQFFMLIDFHCSHVFDVDLFNIVKLKVKS